MEIKSRYMSTFKIEKHDVIMWNEYIYQLLTNSEENGTYPVLNENEVRHLINNGKLIKMKEYVDDFTRVPITLYTSA